MVFRRARRCAAAALIVTSCTLMPAVSEQVTANAAVITGDSNGLQPTAINGARKGSLSIRITAANPYDLGTSNQPGPNELAGFTFTVRRIAGIDLTTADGWKKATSMTLEQARAAEYDYTDTAVTGSDGVAYFEGLPVGLYYVTATAPQGGTKQFSAPQDMLLTVPVGEEGVWKYHLIVNAKYEPVVTPPTKPTTPSTPGKPTTPSTPGTKGNPTPPGGGNPQQPGSNQPVSSDSGSPSSTAPSRGALAMTGANVAVLAAIAAGLIALGTFLMSRNRKAEKRGS
ncbi:SpaA isopeptide-forming pilin-related protein [Corynebacterium sanguinis]|uniref:SpaA isopeptide-forming pilin-related protein n=2 Tax=Corynebacterium sanguinis TaxID=2594913 RepID=UPI00223A7F41|nr:SpaA isopeptide-forming pilin-related protein [Corynebacterium sanguinis]MCT1596863.1 SpaA isopeptide-forming pilin-related protein [Corynebacterium sanguinis]